MLISKPIIIYTALIIASVIYPGMARSADYLKDSDFDGLEDTAEVRIYKTNPTLADSDSDGYNDLIEVQNRSDPVSENSTPDQVLYTDFNNLIVRSDPIGWYVARIFGITAFILLTGVVIMGLTQTSKLLLRFRVMGIPVALRVHRLLAYLAVSSLMLHVSGLFFDKFIKLSIPETLIPFILSRELKSTLGFDFKIPVGLGIISVYLIIFLIFTSERRGKLIPVKIWRAGHYLSFLTYILFIIHGLLSGTDSTQSWMIGIYLTSILLVTVFVILRVLKRRIGLKNPGVRKQIINVPPLT